MHHKMFAVRDTKVSAYNKPFVAPTEIDAVRGLSQAVNDPQVQLSVFPEDFELRFIGEFDDITGTITQPQEGPKFIVSCVSLKKLIQEQKN